MARHQVTCPGCDRTLGITPRVFGKQIECPACGATLKVPVPEVTVEGPTIERFTEVPDEPLYSDEYQPLGQGISTLTTLMVLFVAVCTLAGGAGFGALSELLTEFSIVYQDRLEDVPSVRNIAVPDGMSDFRERHRELQKRMQRTADQRRFATETRSTASSIHKFSVVVFGVGMGILIGGLAIAMPRFRTGHGLVRSALIATSVGLLLVLVLRIVPAITDSREQIVDHFIITTARFQSGRTGFLLLAMLVDLSPILGLGLLAMAFFRLAVVSRSRGLHKQLVVACRWFTGWAIGLIVFYVWVMIAGRSSSSILQYMTWFAHLGMNVVLGFSLFFSGRFLLCLRRRLQTD